MTRRTIAVGTTLAAALAIGGCGTSGDKPDDAAQIKQTYTAFVDAIMDGDGEAVCDTLTDGFQRQTIKDGVSSGFGKPTSTCAQVAEKTAEMARDFAKAYKEQPDKALVNIRVTGDRATAKSSDGVVRFERVDGDWLIADNG